MSEPALVEAPECTPWDPAIVGPPPLDACEPAVAEAPEEYVYMGTGEADPMLAYGHYGEATAEEDDLMVDPDFDPADVGVDPDPDPAAYEEKPAHPPLEGEERDAVLAKPVDTMSDDEFKQMLATGEIDPAQMQTMLDNTSGSAERKLELWKKLHVERNAAEMEEACPESEITDETPDLMKERLVRERTQESTKEELALETSELPDNYTIADVDALIRRKEKEHALEQEYGIDVTAQKEKRADGSRVVWTEDELDKAKAALDQVPPEIFEQKRLSFTELERVELIYEKDGDGNVLKNEDGSPKIINADCHPDGKIRMTDLGAKQTKLKDRELKSPEFEAEHGTQSTDLERVLLHELGHAVNHGDPDTQTDHEAEWKTLVPDKDKDGKDIALLGSGEYFSQDFMNALTAPEKFHHDSIEGPKQKLADAEKAYKDNPTEEKKHALAQAKAAAEAYPKMYENMRNKVFKTNEREDEIAAQLADEGYTDEYIADFRKQAQTVSTPDQLDALSRREGYLPEEEAEAP